MSSEPLRAPVQPISLGCGSLGQIGLGHVTVCVWKKTTIFEAPGRDVGSSELTHSTEAREQPAEVSCTSEAPLGNGGTCGPVGDGL